MALGLLGVVSRNKSINAEKMSRIKQGFTLDGSRMGSSRGMGGLL
jgi:hypothetical protein